MNLNKNISKKYDDSQNIELEIIDSYKQLLGTQYLLQKLKVNHQSEQNSNQSNQKSFSKEQNLKTLNGKVPCDQISKRNFSEILLREVPEISKMQFEIQQLILLNEQIEKAEQKLKIKKQEKNEIMKKHYKYVSQNKPEQVFNKYMKEKLIKNIENLQHEISQIYEIGGRSSISSSSVGNYAIQDWINQQKQQKLIKEQQNLMLQIQLLEKQLQQI